MKQARGSINVSHVIMTYWYTMFTSSFYHFANFVILWVTFWAQHCITVWYSERHCDIWSLIGLYRLWKCLYRYSEMYQRFYSMSGKISGPHYNRICIITRHVITRADYVSTQPGKLEKGFSGMSFCRGSVNCHGSDGQMYHFCESSRSGEIFLDQYRGGGGGGLYSPW